MSYTCQLAPAASPVEMDLDDTHVFWIQAGAPMGVHRVDKLGVGANLVVSTSSTPSHLAVAESNHVYHSFGVTLVRCDKNGGKMASAVPAPGDIGVSDERVFFLRPGSLHWLPLGQVESLGTSLTIASPTALVVDDSDEPFVLGDSPWLIYRVDALNTATSFADALADGAQHMALDADELFWVHSYGTIIRKDRGFDVSDSSTTVTHANGPIVAMAVDAGPDGYVYYATATALMRIRKIATPSDTAVPITGLAAAPIDMAVDEHAIYWVDATGVMRIDKP